MAPRRQNSSQTPGRRHAVASRVGMPCILLVMHQGAQGPSSALSMRTPALLSPVGWASFFGEATSGAGHMAKRGRGGKNRTDVWSLVVRGRTSSCAWYKIRSTLPMQ